MISQNDGIAIVLSSRSYLYTLLKHIFAHEPSLQLMEFVTSEHTKTALDLFSEDGENTFAPYLELLGSLERVIPDDSKALLERLKSEYTYLMLGPGNLPAPPWESVYVTKERLIFQESTLKVRRAYLEYQLLPTEYPHVADDHIAMELDFMAHLARLSEMRLEKEDMDGLEKVLSDQKTFLEEHLLNWIGEFAKQMQSAKTHHFYPQMAALAERIVRIDHAVIDELLSAIERKIF